MSLAPSQAASLIVDALAAHPPRSSGARWQLSCDGHDEQGVIVTLARFDATGEPADARQQTLLVDPRTSSDELTRLAGVAAEWIHARTPDATVWAPSQVLRPELFGLGVDVDSTRRALEDPHHFAALVGERVAGEHGRAHGLPPLSSEHHTSFAAIWDAITYAPTSPTTVARLVALADEGDWELVSFVLPFVRELAETFDSMPPSLQATRPEARVLAVFAARLDAAVFEAGATDERAEDLRELLARLPLPTA